MSEKTQVKKETISRLLFSLEKQVLIANVPQV